MNNKEDERVWDIRSLLMTQLGIMEDMGTFEFYDEIIIGKDRCKLHIERKRRRK